MDPKFADKKEHLKYDEYKNLKHPDPSLSEYSSVRRLTLAEQYALFDVHESEMMNVRACHRFNEEEALGNAIPVSLVELLMEAILIAAGHRDRISPLGAAREATLAKRERLKNLHRKPLGMRQRSTAESKSVLRQFNVDYWTCNHPQGQTADPYPDDAAW